MVAFIAKNEKTTRVTVHDLFGKTLINISKHNLESRGNPLDPNMHQLQKGVYFVSLSFDNNILK
jgi:hypothetical protein